MNFFNRQDPGRNLNLRSHNLLLRISNGPEWIRQPRAHAIIDELTRNDFFQDEIVHAASNIRLAYWSKILRMIEISLYVFAILGLLYFYNFVVTDLETFYYITNRL
ncbi:hypothetical protein HPULCUR_002368 [Helicostylum pulchrum]|uniref:Uncharacterized protein n=1 Tax=Helicostylum pulchrum TaxID=562976 RepID=A0ABP9XRJ5_9FUNG